MCIYTHTWRWPPTPPTPTKNFKAQLLLETKLWHIMCFDVNANMCPMQSKCNAYGGYPHPPTSHKKFQCPITITRKDMAHYIFGCKTPYVPNAKVMQTHKYVHIWHNMSTPEFECPAKMLIPKPITKNWNILCKYVIWYEHITYHRNTHTYVYLTHKTWPHNLECIVIILIQCQSNYGDSAHDFRTLTIFILKLDS